MDEVGGFLEVGRTDDTQEVVIRHPNLKLDANGAAHMVFSPRNTRYLANLLTEHATIAEAEAVAVLSNTSPRRPRNHDRR